MRSQPITREARGGDVSLVRLQAARFSGHWQNCQSARRIAEPFVDCAWITADSSPTIYGVRATVSRKGRTRVKGTSCPRLARDPEITSRHCGLARSVRRDYLPVNRQPIHRMGTSPPELPPEAQARDLVDSQNPEQWQGSRFRPKHLAP